MNITSKASVTVLGTLSADEVKGILFGAVQAEAVKDSSTMVMVSGNVVLGADQSATVELIYEKADVGTDADHNTLTGNGGGQGSTPQTQADTNQPPANPPVPPLAPGVLPVSPPV